MRVVVAPDSFKGVLSAVAAAQAIAEGVRRARRHIDISVVPMADGGEGTLDVLVDVARGNRRRVAASGPLGDPIEASVGLINQAATAVVELASVSGYTLIPPARRNPLKTSTYGLGEVIRAVIETGIEEIILTVGGSATVDGGAGMMQGLGMTFFDQNEHEIARQIAGGNLSAISRFIWERPPADIENVQFTIACDVLNPACGPNGAAAVFGPQKGADAEGVRVLDRGLSHWADLLEKASGRIIRNEPGTGAAGGVALPLLALTSAEIVPGIDLVSDYCGLASLIAGADLVITGEGRLDRQSMMGKVVGAIGRMAQAEHVPCIAIVGAAGSGADECLQVIDKYMTLDAPFDQTENRLAEVAEAVAATML